MTWRGFVGMGLVFFTVVWVNASAEEPAASEASSSANAAVTPQSLGGQMGEAARELKSKADEGYQSSASKIGEASKKMEADAKGAFKTLQEQWGVFSKQLQEKTKQIQKQLEQQWQDFNKSLRQEPQSPKA